MELRFSSSWSSTSALRQWKMGDKHEGMMVLTNAAELRERVNPFDSIDVYARLVTMACDLSRYKEAGEVRSVTGSGIMSMPHHLVTHRTA
jgi:hypothetical protein